MSHASSPMRNCSHGVSNSIDCRECRAEGLIDHPHGGCPRYYDDPTLPCTCGPFGPCKFDPASRATQVQFDKIVERASPRDDETIFEAAMNEVYALRVARSESHWKLFRLVMCQSEIQKLKQ